MINRRNKTKVCQRKPKNMSAGTSFASLLKGKCKAAPKRKFKCVDGALSGHALYLCEAGTMTFTLGGLTGFYNHKMEWCTS